MSFWTEQATAYSAMPHDSLANALHPAIVKMVSALAPSTLLDYGSGDGRLLSRLPSVPDRRAFDTSPTMRELAKNRLGKGVEHFYTSRLELPDGFFDVVICSLILVTLDSRIGVQNMFEDLFRVLRPGGHAILASTHPCFRAHIFSEFYTEFSADRPFNYFDEGKAFDVTIRDRRSNRTVTFPDYHWSLATTIESMLQSGLMPVELNEVRDDELSPTSNPNVPPFLLIRASKGLTPKEV